MALKKAERQTVPCTYCGAFIKRLLWNYGKNRPITAFFCTNTCKGQWQRAQREVLGFTQDWLYQRYIVEGLDCVQIGKLVHRDPKQVWRWIQDYGIPTRARGTTGNGPSMPGEQNPFYGKTHSQAFKDAQRARRLQDGHVPYLKNGVHHLKGQPSHLHPTWKGGVTPERQAFYATQEWKDACVVVWHRANAYCERCGKDHRSISTRGRNGFHVHHIVSFAVSALRAMPTNLVLLCRACHLFVHSKANVTREFLEEKEICQP